MSRATFDRNLQILQQTMQAQMGGAPGEGGPGGPPQGAPPVAPGR
jgi:FKBP-type peptidyl-prolyl cis-trans isomerase FkpA